MRQLTDSTLLAVVTLVAVSTLAHFSKWGAVRLIPISGTGTILVLLYAWRLDLVANMIAHFLTDGTEFLL